MTQSGHQGFSCAPEWLFAIPTLHQYYCLRAFLIPMRDGMRTYVLALLFAILSVSADAQSLQVNGKFGYLGEYELSADVVAQASNGTMEFSGPMIVRHVGLCTHDGPDQKDGQIRLQFASATSRIKATLLFDGRECTYSGRLSETDVGEMNCPGAPALPFSMWSK
jgi:hypothetical protein